MSQIVGSGWLTIFLSMDNRVYCHCQNDFILPLELPHLLSPIYRSIWKLTLSTLLVQITLTNIIPNYIFHIHLRILRSQIIYSIITTTSMTSSKYGIACRIWQVFDCINRYRILYATIRKIGFASWRSRRCGYILSNQVLLELRGVQIWWSSSIMLCVCGWCRIRVVVVVYQGR